LQIQDLVKLANTVNIELVDIETILLQFSNIYKEQIKGNIYSILGEFRSIIHRNIEWQAHHIQVLLEDELDQCKGKGNEQVEEHIKMMQEVYQESYQNTLQLMVIDKGKQREGVI